MNLELTDRTYLVIGASRGLGRATAEILVAEGANVVVVSRDPTGVEATAKELGDRAHGVVGDITDPEVPQRLLVAARDRFGEVLGAFIGHGGPSPSSALGLDDGALRDALELATVGPIRVTREIASALPEGGSVVVLTSFTTVQPASGVVTSNVARPAVWGYAKSLADELGARGVRVNLLLPGWFGTERALALHEEAAARLGTTAEEVRSTLEETIPLGRMGRPEELGRVAAFLLSPVASYVTGTAWAVDGGLIRGL